MVLEDLLRRSWELARYRRPPLGLEVDGFCQWLHEQGYSRSAMRSHIPKVSQFNWYLHRLGIRIAGKSRSFMPADLLPSISASMAVSVRDIRLPPSDA